jgi:hypothetical protein
MQQYRRRNRLILGLLVLGLLAGVAGMNGPVQAQTGVAPLESTLAWDRIRPPALRFLVLTDWNSEAVLDKDTSLVWERSPGATVEAWSAARGDCANRVIGVHRKGFRLPSVHELASLVQPEETSPALPLGHPFIGISGALYWSTTTDAAVPTSAWLVDFTHGVVSSMANTTTAHVWCVRGGMNADAY